MPIVRRDPLRKSAHTDHYALVTRLRTLTMAVAATFGLLTAGCNKDRPIAAGATAATQPSRSSNIDPHIDLWKTRIDGKAVKYEVDLGCICLEAGKWHVSERGGHVIDARYLGDRFPAPAVNDSWLRLSYMLDMASTAKGDVLVSNLSDSSIRLVIDNDPNLDRKSVV